jgi:HAD superfamily hydrolase (TIGR01509 family)
MAVRRAFDVILFDLGGVLIELAGVERMLEWCPGLGTTEELWRRWLHSPAVRRYETGASTGEEFAGEIVREFVLPVTPDDFLAAFAYWPRALYPGVPELLAALAPRYRLASVSNTNPLHWERFCGEWALDACFHANFPSHEVGKLKPDADYFDHVVAALGFDRARILFVDDNRINVEAAAALGLTARHVRNFAALVPTLAGLGVTE